MPHYNITKISDGFGFGTGTISHAGVPYRALAQAQAVITSDDILVPIDVCDGSELADDGCGDGRPVKKFEGTPHSTSLNRAKVFGGGATMAAAILIGNNAVEDRPLHSVFHDAMLELSRRGLTFGDHTDDLASGDGCGCGAVDKAPAIIAAAHQYATQIQASIAALGLPTDGIDKVFAAFAHYHQAHLAESYGGRAVIDDMLTQDKVIKQLAGEHKEKYIVLNTVPHATINQAKVREATNNEVQVFGVDVWRLQQIAAAFPEYGNSAMLATLIYTLATAAVLTAGDLPVYVVKS